VPTSTGFQAIGTTVKKRHIVTLLRSNPAVVAGNDAPQDLFRLTDIAGRIRKKCVLLTERGVKILYIWSVTI
jgi:hypothetical protein